MVAVLPVTQKLRSRCHCFDGPRSATHNPQEVSNMRHESKVTVTRKINDLHHIPEYA